MTFSRRSIQSHRARSIAERIRARVAGTDIRDGNTVLPHIIISAGVASFPDSGRWPQDIIKAADGALYAAKDAGRNCVRSHTAD